MSADTPSNEKERPAVSEPNAPSEATPTAETVICGLDGRVRIEFIEPAPGKAQVALDQPEDCFAVPQRSKHWLKTMRNGSEPRWKRNGGSAR